VDGLLGEPPAELGAVLDLTHALGKYLPHAPGSIKTEHKPDIYDLGVTELVYQPAGSDIERELRVFAVAAGLSS
jgi:hypothetical protein